MRFLLTALAVCAATPTFAQDPPPTKLTLHRSTTPATALKYRLLPELQDMHTGNGAVHYLRAVSPEAVLNVFRKEQLESDEKILGQPIEQAKSLVPYQYVSPGWVRMLEDGTQSTYCDWQNLERARLDGAMTLLPDVQPMRIWTKKLAIGTRISIANSNYDDAHRYLRMQFAMSRHVANGVSIVQCLTGVANANTAVAQLEAWIAQPDSPNLYWALTDLPSPLIDLRPGIDGERLLIDATFPGAWKAKPGSFHIDQNGLNNSLQGLQDKTIKELFKNPEKHASAAKEYLAQHGWNKAQLNTLTALDAVALHQAMEFHRVYEELVKAINLPMPVAHEVMIRVVKEISPRPDRPVGLTVAGSWLPSIEVVAIRRLHLDRTIAALRTIEAIRMHLTEKGSLPDKLADVTAVPIPNDPLTGKTLDYRKNGNEVQLTGIPIPSSSASPTVGKVNVPSLAIHYTLTTK